MDCGLEGLEKIYYNTNLATCYKKIRVVGAAPGNDCDPGRRHVRFNFVR
jgi:hypothetical protein